MNSQEAVFSCILTGVFDVNRQEKLPEDDFSKVEEWYWSLVKHQVRGYLFHNTFSETTVNTFQNEYIQFVRVNYTGEINPNAYRYIVYDTFLKANPTLFSALFLTDVSDVVLVQNPFQSALFQSNPEKLFCGDEPTILANEWMLAHGEHLRNQLTDYAAYETRFAQDTLLNCGIVGGHFPVMQQLISEIALLHKTYTPTNKTAFTLDMGVFNYVARTYFSDCLVHGAPVNTVFKGYEDDRTDCWFRHK